MSQDFNVSYHILSAENHPNHFNCMMFAVGNARIKRLFEQYCSGPSDSCIAFLKACAELEIPCKELSYQQMIQEEIKPYQVLICIFVWNVHPDNYDAIFSYDYHVYRRTYNSNWMSKSGAYGTIQSATKQEEHDIMSPADDPERMFFILG